MKRIYLIITALLLSGTALNGQLERSEIGIRGGYTSSFMYRINLAEDLSYEAQLGYRDGGVIATVLRQGHRDVGFDRLGNWEFIYGMGVHAGFYYTDSYRILFQQIYYGRKILTPVVGFNGYAAMEYQIEEIPMSVGISFQPHMEISLRQIFGINLWDFGINLRYRF